MPDLIDACHYGVARENCHVGCGRWCRPARRAHGAHGWHDVRTEIITTPESVANVTTYRDRMGAYAEPHDACGSDDCCHTCSTATPKETT